ncbi:MAG: GtrA-like protein [Candidatus Nomurabacteria bacterium GW2011_GWD2_36_14]|nr:MAG: GtrA-like protein [Candidatus Nomurabacteria bacterium GW2011_GWE2_36_115]KKP94091.1 MAG: GtrA-like protein [Candidatus Nomurabacteria bacterium GW2011_GWF2_36_126]KKP96781.1 MAG: GtrA-like protein [Candidatus Nomurabacteria bacterium GW2011_GWD2_36_14]KKP99615.1 MAG: GtrA-like protein [Candidatus Nomurabacteria bacterium GW2011_GWF2_36_19]KKQ05469.1 MAG: GtrA-like protein [Candidatus Nomurabacteria bacterium GW2011_GWF1_36_47]KKQ09617.1 MAG: GtrA-like protein [Candidatus Nomurabacteri
MKTKKIPKIAKFGISGIICVGLYYLTLYCLTEFVEIWYPISAAIGSILSYTSSFLFQKYWTFDNKDKKEIPKQILRYFIMSGVLLCANSIFLYLLVEYINLKYLIAQIFITVILSIVSYLITKKIFAK